MWFPLISASEFEGWGAVSVTQILHSRVMGIETWIASDGRAYFVRLHEFDDSEVEAGAAEFAESRSQQVF
jgi:hypothetical protein